MTTTLLDPAFIESLHYDDDARLDTLTASVVTAWAEAMHQAGGYPLEFEPVLNSVAGELVAKQYPISFAQVQPLFSGRSELELQVAALSSAIGSIAQQIIDLAPKPAVINGAMLMSSQQKAQSKENIEAYIDRLIEQLVNDGIPREQAALLAGVMGGVQPRTLSQLLDVSEPTLSQWRTKGAGPGFTKNPGKAGMVRYPIRGVLAWMFENETII